MLIRQISARSVIKDGVVRQSDISSKVDRLKRLRA